MIVLRVAWALATLGFPALAAPGLAGLRGARANLRWKVLATVVCLVPLGAPLATFKIDQPVSTLLIAILGGIMMLKAIDWLANPRHVDEPIRVRLALSVWPALQIEDVGIRIGETSQRIHLAVGRLAGGGAAVFGGLVLTAIGQSLHLPDRGIWMDSSFKVFEIYALAGGANSLMVGAFALAGYRATDGFRYPIFAHSVLDFWGRYNVWVHRWLERHVFEPIGRHRRRPALGILAVFVASGLLHEYLFVVAMPELIGRQLAFFSLHGLGALGGNWLGRRYRGTTRQQVPEPLAIAATLAFVLATAPIFIGCLDRFFDLHRDVGAWVLGLRWSG